MLRATTSREFGFASVRTRTKQFIVLSIIVGLLFGGCFCLEVSRSALPDPMLVFPEKSTLHLLEVDRLALPILNQVTASSFDYTVEALAYRGIETEVPQILRAVLLRSDPWRVAVWRDHESARTGILFGGVGFGRARARWLDEVVTRGSFSKGDWAASELGGAVLLANETSLIAECHDRFESANQSWIETESIRYSQLDYTSEAQAVVELVRENSSLYLEEVFRFQGRSVGLAQSFADRFSSSWREVLEYLGVTVEMVGETLNPESMLPESRSWLIRDLEISLRELLMALREY